MFTRQADYLFVVMAWLFVLARFLHVYIHHQQLCAPPASTPFWSAPSFCWGWIIFAARILLAVSNDPGSSFPPPSKSSMRWQNDLPSGRRRAESLGPRAPLRRLGDRAAIAGLVYDALRRKASSAYLMGAETPRAILLGMLRRERGLDADARLPNWPTARTTGPRSLSDDERARLDAADMSAAPPHVVGDYPEWLEPHFERDLRQGSRRRGRSARLARAARSARQHAEVGARPCRVDAVRSQARARPLVAGRRCVSISMPTPRVRRSMPSRLSSRA